MLRSYFTAAARQFKKNKLHALLNITGLGLGMMTSILAVMFVLDEFSFDQFHAKKDRIYRLNKVTMEPDGSTSLTAETSGLMGPTMVDEFAEVEKAVRYEPQYEEIVLSRGDKNVIIKEGDLVFVDSTFFEVFDFKLLHGNSRTALTRPRTLVLTEKTAKALFGEEDPVGKSIIGMAGLEFEVTGIAAEPPRNSHIQFAGLMSWTTTAPQTLNYEWMNNWIAQGITTYVLLKEDANVKNLESKFPKFMRDHLPTRIDKYSLYLQSFTDLYLRSYDVKYHRMAKIGNQQYIYLFSTIAGFILFIACINYINISTSKSTQRAREVGMRKTMGATHRQLISQFLGESFLLALFSAFLGLGLLYLAVPFFNDLAGKSLPLSPLLNQDVILGTLFLILLVSLVSGLYPSFIISAFRPAEVLRASVQSKITGHWPRYILITFQFVVSIVMIATTLLVYQQIHFVLSKDLGFDKEHVLVLHLTDDLANKKEPLQNEVNSFPNVVSTSVGRTALGQGGSSTYIVPEGFPSDEVEIRMFPADCNFQKTYGLKMASGRFFDPAKASDSTALIINETLARRLRWEDPTRKTIKFNEGDPAQPIIGVLADFNYFSLYGEVQPLVMWISKRKPEYMSIRFSGNPSPLLSFLETRWKTYEGRYPFRYSFLDQVFAASYESEEKLFRTAISFAGLSIVIACLGLYGLVSFTIEQRTKEFGIRKVLGATVTSLNFLVNRKFMVMVFIAAGVAIPLVMSVMQKWLDRFAFRIQVGPGVFLLSILITLGITLLAVSTHSIKIVRANPADSLRHE